MEFSKKCKRDRESRNSPVGGMKATYIRSWLAVIKYVYSWLRRRNIILSTPPRLEARVSAQERRQSYLEARIEELSEDMQAGFKHLSRDMEASFKQVSTYFGTIEERFDKVETDITNIKTDITNIKTDGTDIKTRLGRLETLLIQVLERLPNSR